MIQIPNHKQYDTEEIKVAFRIYSIRIYDLFRI